MQKVYNIILSYHRFLSPGKSKIQVAQTARNSLDRIFEVISIDIMFTFQADMADACKMSINVFKLGCFC